MGIDSTNPQPPADVTPERAQACKVVICVVNDPAQVKLSITVKRAAHGKAAKGKPKARGATGGKAKAKG